MINRPIYYLCHNLKEVRWLQVLKGVVAYNYVIPAKMLEQKGFCKLFRYSFKITEQTTVEFDKAY